MADVDKKMRLAAARKKLKQLQKASKPLSNSDNSNNGSVSRSDSPATIATKNSTPPSKIPISATTNSVIASTKHPPTPPHTDTTPNNPPQLNHLNSKSDTNFKLQNDSAIFQPSTKFFNGDTEFEKNAHDTSDIRKAYHMLSLQNEELKHQMGKLQLSLEVERKNFEERLRKDVGSLKEQLQVHIETVSILVAEKTELHSTCNQIQKISETRQSEIEELAGRLKASRQRVSDLERGGVTLNSSNQKLEKQNKEFSKDLDRLKMDVYKNNKVREEMQQHNLELQGKLQQKMQEIAQSEDSMIELKGKLEMSEVYIEQLKSGQDRPDSNVSKQIEMILTEKTQLQTQLQMQDDSLKLMAREREAMAAQYNDYVQQLSKQNNDLHAQVEMISREKEEVRLRSDELQEECTNLKSSQADTTTDQLQAHEDKSRLLGDVEDLMTQLMNVSNDLQRQKDDNTQLSKMLTEKEHEVLSLEMRVERMSGSKVDNDKLLDEMNNDKTALSRAVSQNKQLKNQFLELQDQFIKMSQKNMELMTKLQSEEHRGKGAVQRLRLQEDEIKNFKNMIDDKTRYLTELESTLSDLKSSSQPSSSSSSASEQDKMAELFRLKVPLIENLQKELSSAQDTVNALTNQNSELKERLFLLEQTPPTNDVTLYPDNKMHSDRVTRLELEKANLTEQLKESTKLQDLLKNKMDMIQHNIAVQAPAMMNGDVVNKSNFEALQHAMTQLEEKYSKVMRDKAEMADANERLEHIIMQLQGETDTIGEYVSLYQHQRHLMRQRTVEKDSLIEQLGSERRQLQTKIHQLQSLVLQLRNEGGLQGVSEGGVSVEDLGAHVAGVVAAAKGRKRKRLDQGVPKEGGEADWPNYSESSGEEEVQQQSLDQSEHKLDTSPLAKTHIQSRKSSPLTPTNKNIPRDNTVSKIMNLLVEMSSSTSSSSSPELFKMTFFCKNCIGDILVV